MALDVKNTSTPGMANGTSPSPSLEERERLYDQLLQLRDVVLAGKHAQFKLPPSAVEQLKASLIVPPVGNDGVTANGQAFATNQQHQSHPFSLSFASPGSIPGLHQAVSSGMNGGTPHATTTSNASTSGLDPIFLQKSEQLVRAETILKRQRIERELQVQVEQRKIQASRDKDHGIDAPSRIDISEILRKANEHVRHLSGLKVVAAAAAAAGSAASSSFDENDYYSSLVQSDWSSDASSTKGSDRAVGAFTDDFERLDGSASKAKRPAVPGSSMPNASRNRPHPYTNQPDDLYDMGDDDDEYQPPDAAAFDSSRDANMRQVTPESDSEYEPGEIDAGSTNPSPRYEPQQQMQPATNVPVIRNHLTHIAAPQPNRVSPLTTTKDANIELELVNGRPEIVQKPSYHAHRVSRVSSASPPGYGGPGPSKKQKKQKKRKRDQEPQGRNKRRQKQAEMETPRSPVNQEPYIKPEPVSPPPFMADVPSAPLNGYAPYNPAQVDLTGSRGPTQAPYAYPPQPHYQQASHDPYQPIRVASPAQRPVQRDNQDLRRVASLHHAKRPISPPRNVYSPVAPYHRAASMAYGDGGMQAPDRNYPPQPRPYSPASTQRYDDAYSSRAASPAMMPPPPPPGPPARRIVQDQYGNRYYAEDSAPSQPTTIRASAVPDSYERAPSRATYAQPPPPTQYYERPQERMPPPPPPRHQPSSGVEEPFEYTDSEGYVVRGYRIRPAERPQQQAPRYSEAPTSSSYPEHRPYDHMPPPPAPQPSRQVHEPTSPTYNANTSRSYSVHPEQTTQPAPSQNHLRQSSTASLQQYVQRQGSVAPIQYAPQPPAPSAHRPQTRAMSVMPGYEYAGAQQQQQQQPPAPRFVDQYGNPVYPKEVRVRQEDYYHS